MAGPKDEVAHLSKIVDPYIVDRSIFVREVDSHVFSDEHSHGRTLGKRSDGHPQNNSTDQLPGMISITFILAPLLTAPLEMGIPSNITGKIESTAKE